MNFLFEWAKKSDGNMSLKYGVKEAVEKNRQSFLDKWAVDSKQMVVLSLAGEDGILEMGNNDRGKMVEADAVITKEINLPLFMVVGDCFPIGIWDKEQNYLALIHAGRKGVEKQIVKKVIDRLGSWGSNGSDLIVRIGPGIRKNSYRFPKKDLEERISITDASWKPWLSLDEEGWTSVDLPGYIKKQLQDCGVVGTNIEDCEIDTFADQGYFSHYRERGQAEGRFGVVSMMYEELGKIGKNGGKTLEKQALEEEND